MPVGTLSLPLGSVLTGQPEVIGSSVLAAAAASVRFDFSPVYRAVLVECWIKNDGNAKDVYLRFNGDSGGNYATQTIEAGATIITGTRATAQAQIDLTVTNFDANRLSSWSLLVMKTTAAAKAQVTGIGGYNVGPHLITLGGEWNNTTDLLTRLDVLASSNNLAAATAITLWGFRW